MDVALCQGRTRTGRASVPEGENRTALPVRGGFGTLPASGVSPHTARTYRRSRMRLSKAAFTIAMLLALAIPFLALAQTSGGSAGAAQPAAPAKAAPAPAKAAPAPATTAAPTTAPATTAAPAKAAPATTSAPTSAEPAKAAKKSKGKETTAANASAVSKS